MGFRGWAPTLNIPLPLLRTIIHRIRTSSESFLGPGPVAAKATPSPKPASLAPGIRSGNWEAQPAVLIKAKRFEYPKAF